MGTADRVRHIIVADWDVVIGDAQDGLDHPGGPGAVLEDLVICAASCED